MNGINSNVIGPSPVFVYLFEDEAMSYICGTRLPPCLVAPLFHWFLAPVIFSRYFIRFTPKPVKADYCARSRWSFKEDEFFFDIFAIRLSSNETNPTTVVRSLIVVIQGTIWDSYVDLLKLSYWINNCYV